MTKVIAHRGSKGTHPENTLIAFQEAIACQCDGIELDVQYTKDQQLVVIHDNTVDRTTDGQGEVDSYTLAEIQQLDAGSWFNSMYSDQRIPLFTEVLELLNQQNYTGILNIEIKTDEKAYPGIEKAIAQIMQKQLWSFKYVYSSFNLSSLERIHEFDLPADKAYIMANSVKKIELASSMNLIKAIHPKINWVMNQGADIKHYPKLIRPWTVNDERQIQHCFKHNLAGIHTDYPREAIHIRNLMQSNL